MGRGYWVEIHAKIVGPTEAKPHGIDYGLCLLDPKGNRLVCFDNAHPVKTGRSPSKKKSPTNDHRHDERGNVKPYAYTDAGTLVEDFWAEVDRVLKDEGISP
ncbi:DUF6516 family protein [Methyloceanibacter sp. wino2]|uniref:toxin-antitoxin system TumE family protein n=1 Tax=Methyloceanibacter sp. wino2 TaxID=2170729 RepID=UPI001FE011DA|nr:DUF6516 family protein [Methyloceanibacter sp. wino2]